MKSRKERRGRPRFDRSWPISLLKASEEVACGKTANISRSGAYVLSEKLPTLEPGQSVTVRIGIPVDSPREGQRTIEGDARVVRLDEADGGCGIALHFTQDMPLPGTEEEKK